VSRAAGKSDALRRARSSSSMGGGGERGGNPLQRWIRAVPAWAPTATGGGQHQHVLHRERDHRAVTRLVSV
jgi:hypothetical protein